MQQQSSSLNSYPDLAAALARGIDLAMVLGAAVLAYATHFDFTRRPVNAPYAALTLSGVLVAALCSRWWAAIADRTGSTAWRRRCGPTPGTSKVWMLL